jgi:hypothetical protein
VTIVTKTRGGRLRGSVLFYIPPYHRNRLGANREKKGRVQEKIKPIKGVPFIYFRFLCRESFHPKRYLQLTQLKDSSLFFLNRGVGFFIWMVLYTKLRTKHWWTYMDYNTKRFETLFKTMCRKVIYIKQHLPWHRFSRKGECLWPNVHFGKVRVLFF